jgi:hypothetical protein
MNQHIHVNFEYKGEWSSISWHSSGVNGAAAPGYVFCVKKIF